MIKFFLFVSLSFPLYALANTTITNLNTIQQLQRNQMLLNNDGINANRKTNSEHRGTGYPVIDVSAILEMKQQAYREWKKKNHSEISYQEWEKKELPKILGE